MNTKLLLAIGAIIIIGVGGYFMIAGKSSTKNQTAMAPSQTMQKSDSDTTESMSFKDLMTMGQSKTCTMSDTNSTGSTDGVVYVNNSKVRGDITTVVSGKTIKSHMILDGKIMYLWMDGQNQGFKMSVDAMTTPSTSPSDMKKDQVDVNKKFNIKCKSWSADNSLFIPPTTIQFMDNAAMMPSQMATTPGAADNMNAARCAACDSVPASSKAQCLTAMGCH